MPFIYEADRVAEGSVSTGTANMALNGPLTSYRTFSSAYGQDISIHYGIISDTDQWEVGAGTYVFGSNEVSRDTVYSSSSGPGGVNFPAGDKVVYVTRPAQSEMLMRSRAADATTLAVLAHSGQTVDYAQFFGPTGTKDFWIPSDGIARTRRLIVQEGSNGTLILGASDSASELDSNRADGGRVRVNPNATDLIVIDDNSDTAVFRVTTSKIEAMLPMQASDGAANAPAYGSTSATGLGLYFESGGARMAVGGASTMVWTGSAIYASQRLLIQNGDVTTPSLAFQFASDTGIYIATGQTHFAHDGNKAARVDAPGPTAGIAETIITREKGDARYVQQGGEWSVKAFARIAANGANQASRNVGTITKLGTGLYQVNFTVGVDALVATAQNQGSASALVVQCARLTTTAWQYRVKIGATGASTDDAVVLIGI